MPAGRNDQTLYNPVGLFTGSGVTTLYKPGELGKKALLADGREMMVVQLDSGATASTGAGAVAAGQLAFWKGRFASAGGYVVTNDKAQAAGGPTGNGARNALCGVFGGAVTAGNFCTIQTRGICATVTTDGGGAAIGDQIVAKGTGTATAVGVLVAQGTAPGVTSLGIVTTAESGTTTGVDLNLPVFE